MFSQWLIVKIEPIDLLTWLEFWLHFFQQLNHTPKMLPDPKMTFADFTKIVESCPDGVILLEGRRAIPADSYESAKALASFLAERFPKLHFRSGNAEGSDQAFSDGVAAIDSSRLQIIAPFASHRKNVRYLDATYDSPETMSKVQDDEVAYKTTNASPKSKGLIANRGAKGRLAAKAAYLIRDTMKVIGHSDTFAKPICALFYVSPDDPMEGGTGHTIRVCQQEGVPTTFQDSWALWIEEASCAWVTQFSNKLIVSKQKIQNQKNMKYKIIDVEEMQFQFIGCGYKKVVYLFNSKVDTGAVSDLVYALVTDMTEDEEGEEIRDIAEIDPSILYSEIAGDLCDELTFQEVV